MPNSSSNKILFILKGYPRLSETFIAQEIKTLESLGLDIDIISLRKPTDKYTHPIHEEISAKVTYLPEYLKDDLCHVLKSWWRVRKLPTYKTSLKTWLKDLKRDFSINRIRRFGQALVLASTYKDRCVKMHSHFIHTPTSVTLYASQILDVPFSISAHAKDIWTIPDWEIVEKIQQSEWLTTCTQYNVEHLKDLCAKHHVPPEKVFLNYHGIDLIRFSQSKFNSPESNQEKSNHTVQLLSVGRAVRKKGYPYLLEALAKIDKNLNWHFTHIGGGERLNELKQQANALNIDKKISWKGSQPQNIVLEHLTQSDVFVLLSIIDKNGDRDGLPNVLMEAQSQSLAVLTTRVSGIPELIENNVNGLFVDINNIDDIKTKLETLINDASLREQLGKAGQSKIYKKFDKDLNIVSLYQRHIDDISS